MNTVIVQPAPCIEGDCEMRQKIKQHLSRMSLFWRYFFFLAVVVVLAVVALVVVVVVVVSSSTYTGVFAAGFICIVSVIFALCSWELLELSESELSVSRSTDLLTILSVPAARGKTFIE